jgi:uncharacterized membrane protein YgaE (UPF0421/DUF939 family)
MVKNTLTMPVGIYIIKCMLGAAICYTLYEAFPQYPLYWSIVSVVLVFAPDVDNNKLARDRMAGNTIGSGVGLILYLFNIPNVILLCIGVAITIAINAVFKLTDATRSALAALVIVIIAEEGKRSWVIAAERVGCVVLGCVVAMLISLLASVLLKWMKAEHWIPR